MTGSGPLVFQIIRFVLVSANFVVVVGFVEQEPHFRSGDLDHDLVARPVSGFSHQGVDPGLAQLALPKLEAVGAVADQEALARAAAAVDAGLKRDGRGFVIAVEISCEQFILKIHLLILFLVGRS